MNLFITTKYIVLVQIILRRNVNTDTTNKNENLQNPIIHKIQKFHGRQSHVSLIMQQNVMAKVRK